jgi:hypothetical protein
MNITTARNRKASAVVAFAVVGVIEKVVEAAVKVVVVVVLVVQLWEQKTT